MLQFECALLHILGSFFEALRCRRFIPSDADLNSDNGNDDDDDDDGVDYGNEDGQVQVEMR